MLKVGILGAGGMGNTHARQYRKMPDVELCFHDRDPRKAEAFQERFQATACSSVEDLMSTCDIIDICLPNDLHLEFGLAAAAAGRAIFMEKPVARSLEDARTLLAAVDKAGVPFMTGHVVRYFPEFRRGHDLVASGAIGTPAAARTRRGGLAPTLGSQNWFMDHNRSGGVLVDLAVHDFDWLRWTLGEVKSLYARSVGAKTMQGPDYALTVLTFESGAVAHCETTWMDPSGFRATYEVCGSDGMVEFDSRLTPSLRTHVPGKTVGEGPLDPLDDPYYGELRGFVEAVRDGAPPPVSAYDGFMALSIGLSAFESARTGQVVVPPRS